MAERRRDDFDLKTKRILAARVGFRCSNPHCRKLTSGPQSLPDKAVNIGVAAHITAASPGGPRYDPTLSPSERSSIENGIWLCQTCAKLIDSDPNRYTVEVLREWKRQAESEALGEITGNGLQQRLVDPVEVLSELLDRPKDWVKVNEDLYIRHRYRPEFVIRTQLKPDSKFSEPWVGKFPDKAAYKAIVEYWQGATLLKKSWFVVADGGRYLIPLPKLRNLSPNTGDNREQMQFVIETSSIEWKTAKLFDQYFPLEQILPRIGILLE